MLKKYLSSSNAAHKLRTAVAEELLSGLHPLLCSAGLSTALPANCFLGNLAMGTWGAAGLEVWTRDAEAWRFDVRKALLRHFLFCSFRGNMRRTRTCLLLF